MKLREFVIMVAVIVAVASVFYLFSPALLTLVYAAASVATSILLVCMLQSNMVDSSTEFRWAVVVMATGCLAVAVAPFMSGYQIGPPGVVRALGELAVVSLMRWRQLKAAGFSRACVSRIADPG